MRDIFTEASPFEIEGENIIYYRGFKDTEKYKHKEITEDDYVRMMAEASISSNKIGKEETKQDDLISIMLETEAWRFVGNKAHFGVYNKSG